MRHYSVNAKTDKLLLLQLIQNLINVFHLTNKSGMRFACICQVEFKVDGLLEQLLDFTSATS